MSKFDNAPDRPAQVAVNKFNNSQDSDTEDAIVEKEEAPITYNINDIKRNTSILMQQLDNNILKDIPKYAGCKVSSPSFEYNAGDKEATVRFFYYCNPEFTKITEVPEIVDSVDDDSFYINLANTKNKYFLNIIKQYLGEMDKRLQIWVGFHNLDGSKNTKYSSKISPIHFYNTNSYTRISLHGDYAYEMYDLRFKIPIEDLKKLKYAPYLQINNAETIADFDANDNCFIGYNTSCKGNEDTTAMKHKYNTLYEPFYERKQQTIKYLSDIDEKYFNNLNKYMNCNFYAQTVGKMGSDGLVDISIPYSCRADSNFQASLDFNPLNIYEDYVKRYFIRAAKKSFMAIKLPKVHETLNYPIFYLYKEGNWESPSDAKDHVRKGVAGVNGEIKFRTSYDSISDSNPLGSQIFGTKKSDYLIKNIDFLTKEEVEQVTNKINFGFLQTSLMLFGRNGIGLSTHFENCSHKYINGRTFTSVEDLRTQIHQNCK